MIDSYRIFLAFKQVENWIKQKEFDPKKCFIPRKAYDNLKPDFLKTPYKRIWNNIENNKYTFKQLQLCICYASLMNEKPINVINEEYINNNIHFFSKKQLKIDTHIIYNLNKKFNITEIKDYFTLDSTGKTIIFNLIMKKYISPLYYIVYSKKVNATNNIQYIENKDHIKFRRIISIIEYVLKQ